MEEPTEINTAETSPAGIGGVAMHARDGLKLLRWLFIDHALLLVLIVMIAAVISVLMYRPTSDVARSDFHLQRSIKDGP
ncbi:hypothetical protein FHT76_008257 [Rhizobium sp. BK176]|nr:hypothetical protein [Rhizobium sp. BK399]MCS3743579.1 hypothetical protein [Rhizobium sp. BK661]MCS4096535.1 hypothetical protein [Rhizobium sp. BK176]